MSSRRRRERSRRLRRLGPAPACRVVRSNSVVRAVAERLAAGVFAAAEPDLLRFVRQVLPRREASALVGAVAERLVLAAATRAPPLLFPRLHGHAVRCFLCRDRLRHDPSSLSRVAGLTSARASGAPANAGATLCEGVEAHKSWTPKRPRQPWTRGDGSEHALHETPHRARGASLAKPWRSTPTSVTTSSLPSSGTTTSARSSPARASPRASRTRISCFGRSAAPSS